jgi:glutamate dehydrogenase (NADP+)
MSLLDSTLDFLSQYAEHQPEYLQAAKEICQHIVPIVNANADYKKHNVLQRLLVPQQIIEFKVEWEDDNYACRVNNGWRVQHNNLLGPFKGGTRFHSSVNLSILKFLALEQTFKNALTGLPIGSGKGGSNFDPKQATENEIRRFCKAYMQSLYDHIGPNTDVPAGDINVSSFEIGVMYGQYLKQSKRFEGALSGKPIELGGSKMREQATGFGVVYFAQEVLKSQDESIEDKTICISGAGNVALHAALKAIELNARVITLSNSSGVFACDKGLKREHIDWLKDNSEKHSNALSALSKEMDGEFKENETPWQYYCDLALPCATQNEINDETANQIVKLTRIALIEGANMPCTSQATKIINDSSLIYVPGKAANAGGVILSGLEMQQNAALNYQNIDTLDKKLYEHMQSIHRQCVDESKSLGLSEINYSKAANIAGFRKVADAMVASSY